MSQEKGVLKNLSGHDALFITFGGIYEGFDAGMPPFEFSRSLDKKGADLIFLRDIDQGWYQFGAVGVGNSIDAIAAYLKSYREKYKRIITIGNSMGGYASMLIGSMIGADISLAIGAQTFIDPTNRKKHNDHRWKEQMARFHAVSKTSPYYDLLAYFQSAPPPKACIMFYGTSNRLDIIHAERMQNFPNFHLIQVLDASHNACKVMRDNGIISRVIDNILADEDLSMVLTKFDSEKQLKRKIVVPSL